MFFGGAGADLVVAFFAAAEVCCWPPVVPFSSDPAGAFFDDAPPGPAAALDFGLFKGLFKDFLVGGFSSSSSDTTESYSESSEPSELDSSPPLLRGAWFLPRASFFCCAGAARPGGRGLVCFAGAREPRALGDPRRLSRERDRGMMESRS